MTKSRKPAAITFPTTKVNGITIRRNAETGIEIHPQGADGYVIYATTRDGSLSYWGDERTLAGARALATERVEMIRESIADDYVEALRIEHAETARVIAEVVADIEAAVELSAELPVPSKVVTTTLYCAKMSAQAGFVQPARDRLDRAVRIMEGTEAAPSDAESAAALAAAIERLPKGTRVELTFGQRYGLRGKIDTTPYIAAETGRVCIGVKVDGQRGYGTEHVDTLRVLVGRDRP